MEGFTLRKFVETLVLLLFAAVCVALALRTEWFLPHERFEPSENPPAVHPRDKFYGVDLVGDEVVWLAGNFGKVIRSQDGGRTWSLQPTPVDDLNLQDIAAWDDQRAVAVGDSNAVIVTYDGGASWTRVEQHPKAGYFGKLIRVETVGETMAVVAGQAGMVMVTRDLGETWHRVHPDQRANWNDVEPISARRLAAVGEFGQMAVGTIYDTAYASADTPTASAEEEAPAPAAGIGGLGGGAAPSRPEIRGARWTEVSSPVELSLKAIAFRDERHGVAVGLSGAVLVTENGGDSWVEVSSGTDQHLWDVLWDAPRDRWLAVGDAGYVAMGQPGDTQWEARRLTRSEFGWHTEVDATAEGNLLVGENVGTLRGGEWELLPDWQFGSGDETQ